MPTLHLLDLDGVLCDDSKRVPFALSKQWTEYFARIPQDDIHPDGLNLYLEMLSKGNEFGYLTGRRQDTRSDTVEWLDRFGMDTTVPLIMRRFADAGRRLPEFKVAVLLDLLHEDGSYDKIVLYDDDPAVINAVNALCQPALVGVHCAWNAKPLEMIALAVA